MKSQLKEITTELNYLSWMLFLFMFIASAIFAEQVQTSKSTLTLPDLGETLTENGLRQAKAIVEIALGEITSDVAGLLKEETTLTKEAAAYEEVKRVKQAAIDKLKKKYDARLSEYEIIVAPLTTEILAFNALPPKQQDAGTRAQLMRRKAACDRERESLEMERVAFEKSKAEDEAMLKHILDPLQTRINLLNAKLGLAYRQLKLCADYAIKINTMLKTKFNKSEIYSPVLNGALEQLKALAGQGFDTP